MKTGKGPCQFWMETLLSLFSILIIAIPALSQTTARQSINGEANSGASVSSSQSGSRDTGMTVLAYLRSRSEISTTSAGGQNLQVLGSGTVGRLTKWSGVSSSNAFIADSNIFENKFGLVGIGTDAPGSPLTVQ